MSISLGSLGIRINRKKLLSQVVELAENRRYWQAVADSTTEAHDAKLVRTQLYQTLAEAENQELLELACQLLTLNEIGRRANETFERIQEYRTKTAA